MIKLEFVALNPNAVCPVANGNDAVCVDMHATHSQLLVKGEIAMVDTSLVLHHRSRELVKELSISLRSGFGSQGVIMPNAPGIIEKSFTGFQLGDRLYGITFCLTPLFGDVHIRKGQRFGQMRITGSDGRLLLPNEDYECVISDYIQDYDQWSTFFPSYRGGFHSTGGF